MQTTNAMTIRFAIDYRKYLEKRLNRQTITDMTKFGSDIYSVEELVAELGGSYLCCHTGLVKR